MSKQARWAWALAAVVVTALVLVVFFALALTSDVVRITEAQLLWLFRINVTVAVVLALVIIIAAVRLAVRTRRGKFGSVLLTKLAGIFALVGVVPGLLLYLVSYQFVSRSIESWFDERVQIALDAGLSLGKSTLDDTVSELGRRTREAALRLADQDESPSVRQLERLRAQLEANELAVLGPNGQVLLSASSGQAGALLTERPAGSQLRQARQVPYVSQLEGLDDASGAEAGSSAALQGVRVRALAALPTRALGLVEEARYLMAVQAVPAELVRNALAVQVAYTEYQQRALARDGLRQVYIGTLTLSLILTVLGAVILAAVLGQQLAKPLLLLADGMRQVAAGDLSTKPVFASKDEVGGLTRSFADMTEQLRQARSQLQGSLLQLETGRTRLQTILDSLSAGVIVFDAQRHIDTVNPGATRILRLPISVYRGHGLEDVPGLFDFAEAIWNRFELHAHSPETGERDHWQDSFELHVSSGEQDTLTLLVRGARLPLGQWLMVFDDISEVISAQRSAAWSEVARRLAHEIKNPLTPIQLSAERLQHKLEAKLEGGDQQLLARSVSTIVAQVQGMQRLVNDFRDYARLPSAQLAPLDLNALVLEVTGLYGAMMEQGRLKLALAPALPPILGDASQLRQVIHNLTQNALDAVEAQADGLVTLQTEAARNEDGQIRAVRLKVLDNGPGFAEKVMKRAFEPYVTTKAKGTGLGLAVVRKIADEHGARIRLGNRRDQPQDGPEVQGAQVSLSFSKLATAAAAPMAPEPTH
ncbi:MAG: HAMP domain-containing protein [Burkholderiales bacterium]|nr:HAMP domain-containing protein [Burkholderiales bacterium]NBO76091.1 HAMP domain-containing protein [Betaproteobacteria bacterium]